MGGRRRRRPLRHPRPGDRGGPRHHPRGRERGRRPGRAGGPPGLRRRHLGHRRRRARRADLLFKIAAILRRNTEELAKLETHDTGKPYEDAVWDIEESAFMFEYYAGWATKISGDIPPIGPDADELRRQGARGGVRPDRAVELPAAHGQPEGGARPWRPAAPSSSSRPSRRRSPPSGWPGPRTRPACRRRPERAHRARPRRRPAAARAPGGRQDQLHRLQGDRSAHHADLCRLAEAGDPGASAARPEHRLRRRRPGRGHPRQRVGHLRQPGEVCSAGSRIFVERAVYDEVLAGMVDSGQGDQDRLRLRPRRHDGPARSASSRDRVQGYIDTGNTEGARLAYAGSRPTRPSAAVTSSRRPSSRPTPRT